VSVALADATPADARPLAHILADWIHATPWMPRLHTPEQDLGFLEGLIAGQLVRVVRIDGVAQGFLARQGAEISALYLAPSARGKGLGAALVTEAKAQSAALALWTFQANDGARRFYDRMGFAEDFRTEGIGNEECLPDIRLVWTKPRMP